MRGIFVYPKTTLLKLREEWYFFNHSLLRVLINKSLIISFIAALVYVAQSNFDTRYWARIDKQPSALFTLIISFIQIIICGFIIYCIIRLIRKSIRNNFLELSNQLPESYWKNNRVEIDEDMIRYFGDDYYSSFSYKYLSKIIETKNGCHFISVDGSLMLQIPEGVLSGKDLQEWCIRYNIPYNRIGKYLISDHKKEGQKRGTDTNK
jgi:large-conductance mechanosensitive channel